MKRFECILSFLFLVICTCSSQDQYGDHEQYPTAKIAVTDNGASDGPSSRYALQVSGDKLHEYLKALKHVPESIYSNGAHIIADMDEASLPESLSASRYDSDQEGESNVDLRSLIPAIRLDRNHHAAESDRIIDDEEQPESESRRRFIVDQEEDVSQYEKPQSRRSFTPRDLLRDLLMRREDIVKSDSPLTPVASAAAQVMNDQITHVKEAMKEAKAQQQAAQETLKEKVVEALKQKEAEDRKVEAQKEFPTASTARVPVVEDVKFKPEDERVEKYRAQESENNYKTQQNYKTESVVIKPSPLQVVEVGSVKEIGSPEIFMGRVQEELGKSLHYNSQYPAYGERENKSEPIDMKTVRELLATLIKQIENIQSAARSLAAVTPHSPPQDYGYEPKKPVREYPKEYNNKKSSYSDERERPKKRKPLPYDTMDSYHSTGAPYSPTKKPKRMPKSERTVYLKPDDVMKLLEPDTYESIEIPLRRNRPYPSSSMRRMHSSYPMRRAMYPSFFSSPGYKK